MPVVTERYTPVIAGELGVCEEIDEIASRFWTAAFEDPLLVALRGTVGKWLEAIRRPAVREAYVRYLPLIHRFVTAELDCAAPSWRGMGRLSDSHPPARLGARFRAQMSDPEARARVGLQAERLVLTGFLLQVALSERPPGERAPESLWPAWLLQVANSPIPDDPYMLEWIARTPGERSPRFAPDFYLRAKLGESTGQEMTRAFEETGVIDSDDCERRESQAIEAQDCSTLLEGAGRMLHDRSRGSASEDSPDSSVLDLLQDYSEQRSAQQLYAALAGLR